MAQRISSTRALNEVNKYDFYTQAERGDLLFASELGGMDDVVDRVRPDLWNHVGMLWLAPDASEWTVLSDMKEGGIGCDPLAKFVERKRGSLALAHRPCLSGVMKVNAYVKGLRILADPYRAEYGGEFGSSSLIQVCYEATPMRLELGDGPTPQQVWEEPSVVAKCALRR
jgi:hypothetical protein